MAGLRMSLGVPKEPSNIVELPPIATRTDLRLPSVKLRCGAKRRAVSVFGRAVAWRKLVPEFLSQSQLVVLRLQF